MMVEKLDWYVLRVNTGMALFTVSQIVWMFCPVAIIPLVGASARAIVQVRPGQE